MNYQSLISASRSNAFVAKFRVRPVIAWLALVQLFLLMAILSIYNSIPHRSVRLELIDIQAQ